MSIRRSNS